MAKKMAAEPVENRGDYTYINAETGEHYRTKPEHMTALSGNRLVPKTNGRIVFRGLIDSLEAEVIEAQLLAENLGEARCRDSLGEILACLRDLLAAEVKESPLPPPRLFDLGAEELHRQSHDVKGTFGMDHPVPDYTMGPLAARLNCLRTKIRQAELLTVKIFSDGENKREDLILVMNRLSSGAYWLFCRLVADKS
jgi:ethanolamine utilization cobalamin adenosyltransferase